MRTWRLLVVVGTKAALQMCNGCRQTNRVHERHAQVEVGQQRFGVLDHAQHALSMRAGERLLLQPCLLVRLLPFALRFALCGLLAFADETLLLVLDASQSIDFFRLFALDFCGSVESDADWGAAGGTD